MRTLTLSKIKAAAALTVSMFLPVFSDAVVDGTFDDNQNDFEYYWYYYDDNFGVGANDRPQADPESTPSTIDVEYRDSVRQAFGDLTDKYVVKAYKFTTATESDQTYAAMPFTFGEKWPTTWDKSNKQEKSFVGIGTMLCREGRSIDLTGATAVRFKIRSHAEPLDVRFKIQTKEIDDISNVKGSLLTGDEFGYYGAIVNVTTSWQEITVPVDELALPGNWARQIDFDIKTCTKLAWEIQKASNTVVTKDTLDIDNIVIIGDNIKTPVWTNTIDISYLPSKQPFSDFQTEPRDETSIGTYWYAYNDADIGGGSSFVKGVVQETGSTHMKLDFIENSGSEDKGYGIGSEYKIGKSIDQSGVFIPGFAGIGCNIYDSVNAKYFNADDNNVSMIMFHYKTSGDMRYVTFELSDVSDVADATKPEQKISLRGSGVVHYRNLPNTGDVWKSVVIPFDELLCHDDWAGSTSIPLDKSKLAKIQWKVQGTEGSGGTFQIDNVYFVNDEDVSVKKQLISRHNDRFNVKLVNNSIMIKLSPDYSLKRASVSIINAQGKTVLSNSTALTNSSSECRVSASSLTSGYYIVHVNGTTARNKPVSLSSHISIIN